MPNFQIYGTRNRKAKTSRSRRETGRANDQVTEIRDIQELQKLLQHLEGELAQLHQTYVSILCKVSGMHKTGPELLFFTKPTDLLLHDSVKSRSREIRVYVIPIALKFDGHIGSDACQKSQL